MRPRVLCPSGRWLHPREVSLPSHLRAQQTWRGSRTPSSTPSQGCSNCMPKLRAPTGGRYTRPLIGVSFHDYKAIHVSFRTPSLMTSHPYTESSQALDGLSVTY